MLNSMNPFNQISGSWENVDAYDRYRIVINKESTADLVIPKLLYTEPKCSECIVPHYTTRAET